MDTRAWLQVNFDADEVRTLIAEYLDIDAKRVTDEVHLSDDLGLDWLDKLELMILIEDKFVEVEFSDAAVQEIEVVGDLIRQIDMSNKAPSEPSKCCVNFFQFGGLTARLHVEPGRDFGGQAPQQTRNLRSCRGASYV
jgi:acyl carrier protein